MHTWDSVLATRVARLETSLRLVLREPAIQSCTPNQTQELKLQERYAAYKRKQYYEALQAERERQLRERRRQMELEMSKQQAAMRQVERQNAYHRSILPARAPPIR